MWKLFGCLLLLILIGLFSMFGCSDGNSLANNIDSANYQVVTVADLHFNPLYDSTLYPALVAADSSQWEGIFQGSNIKTPTSGGTDTNYPLLALTLASMKQNMAASPVVLCTGDLLGHNIPQMFFYRILRNSPLPDARRRRPVRHAAIHR